VDETEEYLTKTVDLIKEHSPPGFARQWYNAIQRAISQGDVATPFGCLTVTNGEVKLATQNVPAGSSRGSLT
jgi:hypothetical protein